MTQKTTVDIAGPYPYEIDHELSDDEFTELAEGRRPFRTWMAVMPRALN